MSEPRRLLKQSINDVLWKIQQLEATLSDFNSDHDLLHARLAQLFQELDKLREHGSSVDAKVPTELLAYIDEGGNPDAYTAEVFERANKANQFSKGKVESLQAFREALKEEIEQTRGPEGDRQGAGKAAASDMGIGPAAGDMHPAEQSS